MTCCEKWVYEVAKRIPGGYQRSALRIRTAASLAAVLLAGVFVLGGTPANATTEVEVETLSFPLVAVALDADVAAANGYELRADDSGLLYSVPVGTPADAPYSGPKASSGGEAVVANESISPFGSVAGNCGSSYIYVSTANKTFLTGYSIKSSTYGLPVSHTWEVFVDTVYGAGYYDLGGFPPWGQSQWSASRTIVESGTPLYATVTQGTVFTVSGWVCYAYGPEWPP